MKIQLMIGSLIVVVGLAVMLIGKLVNRMASKKAIEEFVDHESTALLLYDALLKDLTERKFDSAVNYFDNAFHMVTRTNIMSKPVVIYHYFISSCEDFYEYLFVNMYSNGSTSRILMKFAKQKQKYVIYSIEDQK